MKSHNNEGIPEGRVELAKKYCHEVNERIESYLAKINVKCLCNARTSLTAKVIRPNLL